MAYNKGTKRQFTPVSGFQVYNLIKNSHYAWEAGDYFFVPIIITTSTPNAIIKESVSYVLMLYHPLSEMEATQQQELPASIIQGSEQAVNRRI